MRTLKSIDSDKYRIALEIAANSSFGQDVDFLVVSPCEKPQRPNGTLAYTLPLFYPDIVFLMTDALNNEYFDVIIAHELGHLKLNHGHTVQGEVRGQEEIEADNFAKQLVGVVRFEEARKFFAKIHAD